MIVQAYTCYNGTLTVAAATPRPDEAPSTHFTAAKIQEDYAGQVRSLLREWKHIGTTSLAYPVASRLQTYFPVFPLVTGQPLYALRELRPTGSPRGIDAEMMLEMMSIQYALTLVLLPPYFGADETTAEGIERAVEYAVKQLFAAAGVPNEVIPGDNDIIDETATLVSIGVQLGAASARMGVEIGQPTGT